MARVWTWGTGGCLALAAVGAVTLVGAALAADAVVDRVVDAQLRSALDQQGVASNLTFARSDTNLLTRTITLHDVRVFGDRGEPRGTAEAVGCGRLWISGGALTQLACDATGVRIDGAAAVLDVPVDAHFGWSLDRRGTLRVDADLAWRDAASTAARLALDGVTPTLLAGLGDLDDLPTSARLQRVAELAPDLALRELAVELRDRGARDRVLTPLAEQLGLPPHDVGHGLGIALENAVRMLGVPGTGGIASEVRAFAEQGGALRLGTNIAEPLPIFQETALGRLPVVIDPLRAGPWVLGLGIGVDRTP